jgi:lipid-A-disaccharide synthase
VSGEDGLRALQTGRFDIMRIHASPHGDPALLLVAGESSGDLHGANLIRALRALDPELECEGLGGTRMAGAGMTLQYDLAAHAIMGFSEIIESLGLVRRLLNDARTRLREWRPDALVLIDYPGFNMRLARAAHDMGIKVIYYISPQVWAWRRGRVKTLARILDKMIVILPFEKEIYDAAGLECAYVGHPLLDHVQAFEPQGAFVSPCTIGLMPGSRQQEIDRIFPIMIEVAHELRERYPDARFVTPCVDEDRKRQIEALAGDFPLETVIGGTYELLSAARFCLVASGTATVETLRLQRPDGRVSTSNARVTYRVARFLRRMSTPLPWPTSSPGVTVRARVHSTRRRRVKRILPEIASAHSTTPRNEPP